MKIFDLKREKGRSIRFTMSRPSKSPVVVRPPPAAKIVSRRFLAKIQQLPSVWALPLLRDCALFYWPFGLFLAALIQHIFGAGPSSLPLIAPQAALLSFAFSWLLIAVFSGLQKAPVRVRRAFGFVLDDEAFLRSCEPPELRYGPLPKQKTERLKFADCVWVAVANQLWYFSGGFALLFGGWGFASGASSSTEEAVVNSFTINANSGFFLFSFCLHICCMLVLYDALVYLTHRFLLHEGPTWFGGTFLQRIATYSTRVHERYHHAIKGTLPVGGWYLHWWDCFLELFIPIFGPPMLVDAFMCLCAAVMEDVEVWPFTKNPDERRYRMRVHWITAFVWILLAEWDTASIHSGFDLMPGVIPGPKGHWIHHLKFNKNYSAYLLDFLLETRA